MSNILRHPFSRLSFSPVSLAITAVAVLATVYVGLIAVVMSYATVTIEFSQSVRDHEAVVATLEAEYLSAISRITTSDYGALGYAKPLREAYVPQVSGTALR